MWITSCNIMDNNHFSKDNLIKLIIKVLIFTILDYYFVLLCDLWT